VGALFYYELFRLARRPRLVLIRCGYILAVFVTLFVICKIRHPGYAGGGTPMSRDELSEAAKKLVQLLLMAQTVAVVLLTPAYMSDVIAGERERHTLDLLLTSQLSERQIVLGKLLARSLHLCCLFLAGIPVLLVSQSWGGVDYRTVAVAFLVTFLNVFSVGALCTWESVRAPTRTRALISTYALAWYIFLSACSGCCLTPSAVFQMLTGDKASTSMASLPIPFVAGVAARSAAVVVLIFCVTVNALIAYVSIRLAAAALNPFARGRGDKATPGSKAGASAIFAESLRREWSGENVRSRLLALPLPPIGDRPLLWRESCSRGGGAWLFDAKSFRHWRLFLFVAVFMLAPLVPLRWLAQLDKPTLTMLWLAGRYALLAPLALGCVVVAMRAAGSLGRDRDSRRLDSLLTLPVSRSELLGAKWLGALLPGCAFAFLAACVVVVHLAVGGVHPGRLILLAVGVAIHAAFFASLGVWLSLVCRTTLSARVTMGVVLIVAFGFAAWVGGELGWFGLRTRAVPGWVATAEAVLPPAAWWSLTLSANDPGLTARPVVDHSVLAFMAVLSFAALAAALWMDALRRFRRFGFCGASTSPIEA
jgi:ABC-type transport system involved in multi-copper enzyme maturation permease subunit